MHTDPVAPPYARKPNSTSRHAPGRSKTEDSMSIFGSIMEKIFHSPAAGPSTGGNGAAASSTASVSSAPTPPPAASVDVEQVLTQLASQKGGGGNWQTSIVDLLKLLDLDSGLGARKELASELNVHAGADGSAEE